VVEREAHRPELLHDLPAVVADEVGAARDKRLATKLAVIDSLRGQSAHHHRLQGDPGMVVPRLPERAEAAHPVIADQHVLAGSVERMPHMQAVGDVRGRQADHERLSWIRSFRVVEALLLPRLLPAGLDSLRAVERLHGAILRAGAERVRRFMGSEIWTTWIQDATNRAYDPHYIANMDP